MPPIRATESPWVRAARRLGEGTAASSRCVAKDGSRPGYPRASGSCARSADAAPDDATPGPEQLLDRQAADHPELEVRFPVAGSGISTES